MNVALRSTLSSFVLLTLALSAGCTSITDDAATAASAVGEQRALKEVARFGGLLKGSAIFGDRLVVLRGETLEVLDLRPESRFAVLSRADAKYDAIVVRGERIYARQTSRSSVDVLSLATGSALVRQGGYDHGWVEDFTADATHLYIKGATDVVEIIDARKPNAMSKTGALSRDTWGSFVDMPRVDGIYANAGKLLVSTSLALYSFDIDADGKATQTAREEARKGMYFTGDYATTWDATTRASTVHDLRTGASVPVFTADGYSRWDDIATRGTTLFGCDRSLSAVDFADPAHVRTSSFPIAGSELNGKCRVLTHGDETIAVDDAGVHVVRFAADGTPSLVAQSWTVGEVTAVRTSGDRTYVLGPHHLVTLGTSADGTFVALGGKIFSDEARLLEVEGNTAYVGLFESGGEGVRGRLDVVDVADAAAPATLGAAKFSGQIPSFVGVLPLANGYAYVPTVDSGLSIVDVHDRAAPKVVATYVPARAERIEAVAVKDVLVLAARGEWEHTRLERVDVSNPASPVLTGSGPPPNGDVPSEVQLDGQRLLVQTSDALTLLDRDHLDAAPVFSTTVKYAWGGMSWSPSRIFHLSEHAVRATWFDGATGAATTETFRNDGGCYQHAEFLAPALGERMVVSERKTGGLCLVNVPSAAPVAP